MRRASTAVLSLAIGTTPALAQYTLFELEPLPGGSQTFATGIDNQGRMIGTSRDDSGFRMAVIWPAVGEPPVALGLLDGGTETEGVAINDGVAIGVGDRTCGLRGAFVWSDTTGIQAIGPTTCTQTQAFSFNSSGEALLLFGLPSFPAVWPIDGGAPRFLDTWGEAASVFQIDDQGRVYGASAFHPEGGGTSRAIQWNPDGSGRLLDRLDDSSTRADVATDHNEQGLIVGQAGLGGVTRATVWDGLAAPIDAGAALGPDVPSSLFAVNGLGQAVGSASVGAITWDADAGARVLSDLVDASVDGWALTSAQDINDTGVILGNGVAPGGSPRGFVLVGEATPCAADLDGDGSLTLFDFLAFQNLFDAGDARADFDGDGSLTIFDFLAFQNEFDAGC